MEQQQVFSSTKYRSLLFKYPLLGAVELDNNNQLIQSKNKQDMSSSRSRERVERDRRSRSRSGDRIPTSKKIYISNLNPETDESKLRDKFEEFGTIEDLSLKRKGLDITFAFVEYGNVKDAEKAINAMNRNDFEGRSLKVEFARSNGDRGGFRGGRDRGGFRGGRGGSSGGFGDRPRGPSDSECFNCHGFGHFARDCPKPREGGFRGSRDNGSGRSYGGGSRGYGGREDRYGGDREKYGGDRDRRRRSRSSSGGDRRRRDRNDDY